MTMTAPLTPKLRIPLDRAELARRVALAREAEDQATPRPHMRHLLGEFSALSYPFRKLYARKVQRYALPKAKSPQTVMLLPGFATHPERMRYFAETLEAAGHTVKRWGLGFNFGPSEENFAALEQRLLDLHRRAGEPVTLVGWSLGGLFARELAKLHPDAVAKVITMGTPFSYSPRANNAWRIYQFVAGHRVEAPPIAKDIRAKPPVETVALWSANDGIVHPRAACGKPGERDRAVALRCRHMGFAHSHEAIEAVARELDRS
ncbi:alpha/beta hydrolase [Erythrobacter sp. SDW2]|uniref:esterase/lipase family protein n=1 Tax=Erythrobacter sp. SDW2 TaxID=2907154 RepID=UPI001F1EEBD5|nr:alpha/beta hydrolase [Erythrobacter sp. SDW2]UIP07882.1 alpha/beta hydrolase [Erythrobacter sp. SDW2]